MKMPADKQREYRRRNRLSRAGLPYSAWCRLYEHWQCRGWRRPGGRAYAKCECQCHA